MPADDLPPTSASLLGQLYDPNQSDGAWRTFLDRYQPGITAWCRRLGLQEADAQEVTSEVLLRLARALPTLRYDPQRRFRAWLRTVVHNAVCDFWREQARRPGLQGTGDSTVAQLLEQAPDSVLDELVEQMDDRLQADLSLARRASQRVQNEVLSSTWQAFWQTIVEGQAVPEVAARLGMSVASVYMARKRVGDRLRQAAAELQGQEEGKGSTS
jgi:RNA polymerase sigma-70 factor (ECF subfamily)